MFLTMGNSILSLLFNSTTKFLLRRLPQKLRITIAYYLRTNSYNLQQRKLQKNSKVFDISQAAVEAGIKKYQVTTIIHGHIHTSGVHEFIVAGKCYQRFVLGDWGNSWAKILVYEDSKFELTRV